MAYITKDRFLSQNWDKNGKNVQKIKRKKNSENLGQKIRQKNFKKRKEEVFELKDLISLAEIGARMEFLRQKKFNSNEN